ncbi:MAG: type secretion system secreted protein Hcp [Frankiaceae bacterium]|jgi:type VI secretion system secreted protein Hcp|nr:type secretion system secreted protein Hcp [Frankiaceae bacterium]
MTGHALPPILRRTKTWLIAGVMATAVAVPSGAGAAEPPVRACVQPNGALRLISSTAACKAGETLVVWSRSGPAGPAGPKGATGVTGPAGPAGPTGQNGQNGQNGKEGAPGTSGGTGLIGPQGPAGPAGTAAEKSPLGQSAFMRCTSIDGGATGNTIEVYSYSWGVSSPRDAASGQASGKRQHKPFTITKELDKATPLLFNRLFNNTTIPFCVITFVHKTTDGSEPYMTITMTNAQVAGVESKKGDTRSPEVRQLNEYEEVSFTYQKITWESLAPGGISAEDDWEAPVA